MKRSILNISLLAAGMLALSSCSSDDLLTEGVQNVPGVEEGTRNSGVNLESKTYSQESLLMSYNGSGLYGKKAAFTVTSPGEAEIVLSGDIFDVNSLIGGVDLGFPEINTCGVFPGSPVSTLKVALEGSENECSFKGSSESEYCTFSYEGTVNADVMSIDFYDVKLKDTTMADSSASLADYWDFRPYDDNFYNNLRVVWNSEVGVELMPGFELPIGTIVSLALVMPIVNEQNVAQLLTDNLKKVQFAVDGNIVATYVDPTTGNPVESTKNIAQYVVKGDKVMLYLNPQAIIADQMAKMGTRSDNVIMDAVNNIVAAVIPMFSEGVPLTYGKAIASESVDENGQLNDFFDYPENMSVYLGTEVLKPLMTAVASVLADENIKQIIIDLIASSPDMAGMSDMVNGVLSSFPEIVEKSSVIEVGINLKRAEESSVPQITVD